MAPRSSFIPFSPSFCSETKRWTSLNPNTASGGQSVKFSSPPQPPPPPHCHSVSRCLQILLMPPSGSGAESFSLLTNKLAFVFEWLLPSSPSPPAAGEAGRKFSMKQRRHAARWLTSGAQGHRCWLEKANTLFEWSVHFHSKFREAKRPDGSKYSSFIPVDNAYPILRGWGGAVWTKNIKQGPCRSGVNLLGECSESKEGFLLWLLSAV